MVRARFFVPCVWVLAAAVGTAGDLKGLREIPGAFELHGADGDALRRVPRENVSQAYGREFLLREGKMDVCSWEYANHRGLLRRLRPLGADLSGDRFASHEVEPDTVAIDTQAGRVKFFPGSEGTDVEVVGRARTLHGAPTSIAAIGDFAFLSNGEGAHTFQVVDGRDMDRPWVCAALPCGNYARLMSCSGRLAFYGVSFTGLWIIDVSDPAKPRKLSLWEPPGDRLYGVNGGLAYGSTLYISGGGTPPEGTPEAEKAKYSGTFIVDISDPAQPKQVGRLDGYGYRPAGDRLVRDRTDGPRHLLDIYSLKNPHAPELIWSYPWAGGWYDLQGDRLLALSTRQEGQNKDVVLMCHLLRGPAENALLSEVSLRSPPFQVETLGLAILSGSTLFLTSDQDLLVIDVSDVRAPKLLGRCWSGPAMTMALGDRKLFCGGGHTYQFGESGVWVIDLTDLSQPRRRGYVPTGGEGQNNWVGLDGKLCLAGGEWGGHNWVVDVSNRRNPRFLGTYFDRYFNGNNSFNLAVGNTFYMDDNDGTKILDLRVWEKYLGQNDPNFRPLVIDTYGCTPETVRGLLQVRHRSLADGQKGADFYMARGHITSSPFQLPKGDYVLDLRYQGHRDGAHESVRLLLLDGAQRVYDTGYLPSKGKAIVEEKLTLTVTQDMAEARVHLTGCDVTVHQAALSPPSGGTSVIPNGDFEQAGPSALQVPGWEVGGPRHTWWGRLPAGMNYQGILQFEDRIYTLYSGRRIYVFDATADPVDLLTPGGMVLPVSHDILTFCVRGSLLYAVSTDPSNDPATKPQNNFLQIVDISDLKSPKLLGEYHRDELGMEIGQFMPYPPNGWVGPHYGMAVSKDILVCGERYHYREAYIHAVDVRNPRKPKWIARFDAATKEDAQTECWGYRKLIPMGIVAPLGIIFEGGRWLYTAEYWSGAKIFDLADPARPRLHYNEIEPFRRLTRWEDRKSLIPEGFFYMPGYTVNAWCGGEVWGHHMICTRLSHCAVLKVPRVPQSPRTLSLEKVGR